MSGINLLSAQFCSDVNAILSNYWRGYYSDALAECDTRLKKHGLDLVEWERLFIQAVQIYLRTWRQDSACLKFLQALNLPVPKSDVEAQWIRFYQQLLYTWLSCQERANFDRLDDARRHADRAVNMLTRMKRESVAEFAKPLEQYPFLPKPWSIFWFRALVRHALTANDEARKDFERAHRELRFLSESYYGEEPRGKNARLERIRNYCHESALLAGRFYGDMGMFLFEIGDMRTAKEALELAVGTYEEGEKRNGIDPDNAYMWSNLGFVLYSFKKDDRAFCDEALDALLEAYRLASTRRDPSEDGYYASGRIYYFLGAFAYRWLRRDAHPYEGDMEGKLEKKIACLPKNERPMFGTKSGVDQLLSLAFDYYLKAKDLARALPAFIVSSDPLSSPSSDDPMIAGARRLLWEYSYGMGDFLASQTRYQRMTDQYLLEGILAPEEEA